MGNRGRTFLLNPQTISASSITAASITDTGLTSGRVVIVGTGGLLADDGGLTYNATLNFLQVGTSTAADGGFLSLPNPGGTGEYLEASWTSNEASVGTTTTGTARAMKVGSGGASDLQFYTTNTVRWRIGTTSGNFAPLIDNTYGIGNPSTGVKQFFASYTDISGGVTGNATISKMAGSVNLAAGVNTLVVTNTLCTTSSKVFAQISTSASTGVIRSVVPLAGSFVINMSTAPGAETRIQWWLLNTN